MSNWKDVIERRIEAIRQQPQLWNDYWDEYTGEDCEELDADKFGLAIQEALKVKNEEMTCIKLLADIRQACGDDGKRMQDELVQYAELYRQAESVPKGWKPISTAPMDGTQVLLCTLTGKIADGMFSQKYKLWSWPYVMVNPTHWMQRPELPEGARP